jgi:signal transduction histidine kinase/ActR/RegA family two-component response regulator
MIALCTYCLDRCSAAEVMDVVSAHQFALLKREGSWQIVENAQHKTAVVALREIREQYEQREFELRKLNQTLQALSDSDQAMVRAGDETEFLQEICRIIVEDCGHAMVWIGFAEDDEARSIRPAASAGFDKGYLATLRLTYADEERGRGPTGAAIRTGRVCLCRDMLSDPKFAPWREEAIKRGYASSIALPLVADQKTLGALTIYGRVPDAFPPEEVRLLGELAGDLAYGITAVRWRAARARAEGELLEHRNRLAELVRERTAELEDRNRQLELEMEVRKRAEEDKRGLERQLVQVQKMEALGRFAGGIAHDLNNLLYPIIITAEALLEDMPADDPLRPRLVQIRSAANRQKDLVSRILAFSRRSEPQLSPTRVSPLVEETLDLLRASLPATIEIRHRFEAGRDTVLGDATQIQQVLINLCRNAADAIGQRPGAIEIALRNVPSPAGPRPGEAAQGSLEIAIEDTGCGMGPEVMDRIFEPFFTTKEAGRGTGMGLAVVHGIIKSHGGEVSVSSEEGKGSRFSVLLPLTEGKALREKRTAGQAPAPAKKGTVLLVDDEEIIVSSVRSVLERLGFEVVPAMDSGEALRAFAAKPDEFVLVITDLTMPKMTGLELAEKIRRIRAKVPIVLSTGFGAVVTENAARAHGVTEVLVKPAGVGELKAAVDRALGKG